MSWTRRDDDSGTGFSDEARTPQDEAKDTSRMENVNRTGWRWLRIVKDCRQGGICSGIAQGKVFMDEQGA